MKEVSQLKKSHSSGDTTEGNVNSGEERKLKRQLGGTSTQTSEITFLQIPPEERQHV